MRFPGDSLRGSTSPTTACGRRPAPTSACPDGPSPGLRGSHARGGGGHVAAGGLRGAGLPAAAAAVHCLCPCVSGGHALRRRDPRGSWSDLHSAPAAPGPRIGSVGAQASATRLHAHRCADHHLLLLAHRHHRHLQGRAGAHGFGPRRFGVCRDRFTRSPEFLLHLPGRGHRSHGALYHPHCSHHHRRPAPRKLLGSLKTSPSRPHSVPPNLPGASRSSAAYPTRALHSLLRRRWTSRHHKLRPHGTSGPESTLSSSGTPLTPTSSAALESAPNPNPPVALVSHPIKVQCQGRSSPRLLSPVGVRSQKPCLIYELHPNSHKPRLQVGRPRLLFRLLGCSV
ncbi:proline-rich transmembrane protein 1 isoform X2 [Mus musculus]|uniref:proline-rich transmembrane protein 1 isoform X2 n=1 Tax=Mus musculus TaxID=10090 RepID=UPI0011AEBBC9|nr:proline-rich transmembrane protein 1 isoform X2 [Mus musculus]